MLDHKVTNNFMTVKIRMLIPPFLLLFLFCLYFFICNDGSNYIDTYIAIQKEMFFYINEKLSKFSSLQFNLTQLGDVLIFFSLITIFIVYAPKLWEVLLTSAIISLIVSAGLKEFFKVPRPAKIFDNDSFNIIGTTLTGHSSLPSGHSIATFVVITTLLFAFMPKKNTYKISWSILMLVLGFIIAFSRVGVGAHYPIDVLIGSTIGYIVTIIGIKISNKVNWFTWIKNNKYYPFFIVLFLAWMFIIYKKILENDLPIFYISLISLIITLYIISNSYVKKKN